MLGGMLISARELPNKSSLLELITELIAVETDCQTMRSELETMKTQCTTKPAQASILTLKPLLATSVVDTSELSSLELTSSHSARWKSTVFETVRIKKWKSYDLRYHF